MTKEVILTGLRSNQDLHIGNYLGALLPAVDMMKEHAGKYQVNIFVPDLHSFTTPVDHTKLYNQTMSNLKTYVAAGLDLKNKDLYLYRQSFIPGHAELTWILDCFTGMGEMRRMTQFKDKSSKLHEDRISLGLFNYPVLMAADILLYGAAYVPVGDDQSQHLEFTRDIAERMNKQFGELFIVPLPVKKQHEFFNKDQGLRIRDLIHPENKMSKSDPTGKGVLFLSDRPGVARKKVLSATTDSKARIKFDFTVQPGISNLLQILGLLSDKSQKEINARWEGKSSYGELKKAAAGAVEKFLEDFQARLASVDREKMLNKLVSSEFAMTKVASATLLRVQQAVGLRTPESKTSSSRRDS